MTHDTWAYHDFCLFLLTLLSYHFFPCVKLILIIQKKSGLTSLQFGKTTEKPPSRIKFKIKIWSSKSIYTGWPRSRAFFTFTHFFFQNRSFLVLYTHNVEIPLHMCACVDKTVLWTRIKWSILRVLIIFDFIIRRYLNKCFSYFYLMDWPFGNMIEIWSADLQLEKVVHLPFSSVEFISFHFRILDYLGYDWISIENERKIMITLCQYEIFCFLHEIQTTYKNSIEFELNE